MKLNKNVVNWKLPLGPSLVLWIGSERNILHIIYYNKYIINNIYFHIIDRWITLGVRTMNIFSGGIL